MTRCSVLFSLHPHPATQTSSLTTTNITRVIMDQSPLHRIGNKAFPAEVRNKIFKLAVTFDSPLSLASLADASGITRVCRQTRSETRLLFYASNSFEYASPIKLSWPLMAGRFQMGKLRKNPPRDAHSKQLCGLLKITLGYDTLKLIRRISISGIGDDNERAELTIFIGADAVAEHVQLPMWIKTQKGLTEDDPSSLTGFLAPRDPVSEPLPSFTVSS